MKSKLQWKHLVWVTLSVASLAVALVPASARGVQASAAKSSPTYMYSFQQFHINFTRNFNPLDAVGQMDFTKGGIYEPLAIFTSAGGTRVYPWLATSWQYIDNNRALVVTMRHGVRWSDGTPFTVQDVYFTLWTYARAHPAADQLGVALPTGRIAGMKIIGSDKLQINFKAIDTTYLPLLLGNVFILPQHIWSSVAHPDTFKNPNPVGTGPFTEVENFSGQGFVLGKNPYYWQPGKPAFDGVKLVPYVGNDSANLSMVSGQLDWTDDYVPHIQSVYVARDPAHFHYYYDTHQPTLGIFFNDTLYPYSLPAFRKAISYAINRAAVNTVAEDGYEPGSTALAMEQEWPSWVDPSLMAQSKEMATYNPAKAKATFLAAGFTYKGNQLYDPHGKLVSFTMKTPSSFTDWLSAMDIFKQDFQAVGIDANWKPMDENQFYDQANRGELDAELYWTNNVFSPHDYFLQNISKTSYAPTGTDCTLAPYNGVNYERYYSVGASALLKQFEQTTDLGRQKQIMYKVERIFLQDLPFVPTNIGALWYTYSTKHFTGWPTAQNDYAYGSPAQYPDNAKVLTTITPA